MEKRIEIECNIIRRKFAEKGVWRGMDYWGKLHGLSSQQFSRWENGHVVPTLAKFLKWRKAAGFLDGPKCQAIASRTQKIDLIDYLLLCEIFDIEPWS